MGKFDHPNNHPHAFKRSLLTSICYNFFFIVERSYVRTIDYFLSDLFAIVMNLTAASF